MAYWQSHCDFILKANVFKFNSDWNSVRMGILTVLLLQMYLHNCILLLGERNILNCHLAELRISLSLIG